MTASAAAQRYRRFLPVALVLLTFLVFSSVPRHEFITTDDDINFYKNPHLLPLTWDSYTSYWREVYEGLYVPVTYSVETAVALFARLPQPRHVPGCCMTDLNPHVFHGANLALHILNVLLAWAVLGRLVRHDWAAAAGALLFAIHPVQAEPVSWVTSMKDTVSTACALLAMLLFLQFRDEAARHRPVYLIISTLAFAAALLAKPSTVILPLMVLVMDWMLGTRGRRAFIVPAIWILLAIPVIALTQGAQPLDPSLVAPLRYRPLLAADAFTFYLGKLVLPLSLCIDYGRHPGYVLSQPATNFIWLVPLSLAVVLWRYRRRHPWLAGDGLLFFIGTLPVLGLIPFGFQQHSTVADRYLYLAMLGPALLLAGWLARRPSRISFGIAGVYLLALAVLCYRQAAVWRNDFTLYEHAIQVNPTSYFAQGSLGDAYSNEHDYAGAAAQYRAATRLNPRSWSSYTRLGNALWKLHDPAAIEAYRASIAIDPTDAETQNNLGAALADSGQMAAAIPHFQAALKLEPNHRAAAANLQRALATLKAPLNGSSQADIEFQAANTLVRTRQFNEAISHYRNALKIRPNWVEAHENLGVALSGAGNKDGALAEWHTALRLNPKSVAAHVNLGDALLQGGQFGAAIPHYRVALKADPAQPGVHFNLGLALQKQGDATSAVNEWQEALKYNPQFDPAKRALTQNGRPTLPGF